MLRAVWRRGAWGTTMSKQKIGEREMAAIVREAVDRLPGGFVIFGPNHEILLSNAQNERDFPFTNEALREGKSYLEATYVAVRKVVPDLPEDQARAVAKSINDALSRGEPVELRTHLGTVMQVVEIPLSFGGWVAVGADV